MKKIFQIFSMAILVFLISVSHSSAQNDSDNPVEILKRFIPHGIPFERTKDIRNFLIALKDNEKFANAFSEEVVEEGKKDSINIAYIYRGNMIEYIFSSNLLKIHYQLWLDSDLSQYEMDVQYFTLTGKSLFLDPWLTPKLRNVTLSEPDKGPDFVMHARMVANMMKWGVYIPHKLANRLSYNLGREEAYLLAFKELLREEWVKIEEDGEGNFSVNNGRRRYKIATCGILEPTFEVTPLW